MIGRQGRRAVLSWVLVLIAFGCNVATPPDLSHTIYMVIENATPDSGVAVLRRDSGGPDLMKQIMRPRTSLCWTSIMVDSLYYNVGLWIADSLYWPLGRVGGEGGMTMTLQSLRNTHKFRITIISPSPPPPYAQFNGIVGSGCP